MRNTIILNGQSSSEITGLLIQSLPPITKPAIRTETEEIDGRDGDIVTKLGYSAYTKEFTIGLYGEFDIDEVIAYFDSEGVVIFSNEPDKYYKYQITTQIDFDRLIRFRTATVKMHCQPFKYSATEGTEVFGSSDNLINFDDFTKTTNGITLTATDGEITITGTPTAATEFYLPLTNVNLAAGEYELFASTTGTNASNCSIRLIGSAPSNPDSFGGKYITLANNGTVTLTDTLEQTKTFGYLWFYINAGASLNFNLNVRLEDIAVKTVSGEGSTIELPNTTDALFTKLDIKGDTDQTTYSGKNLLNANFTTVTRNGLTYTNNGDGSITVSGTATANTGVSITTAPITLEANTAYTQSVIGAHDRINVVPSFKNASETITYNYFSNNSTKTSNVEMYLNSYDVYVGNGATVSGTFKIQLEKGSTATDYEPYVGGTASPNPDYPQEVQVVTGDQTITITDGEEQEQTYSVSLGSIELCKISGYQDYIYKQNGIWYLHKEIGKQSLNIASLYYVSRYSNVDYAQFNKPSDSIMSGNYGNWINGAVCTHATPKNAPANWNTDTTIGGLYFAPDTTVMWIGFAKGTTSDEMKAKLSGAEIYYRLATPTDTEITDSALLTQLNNIANQAHAYRGTTFIVTSGETEEDLPHILAVETLQNKAIVSATVINNGNTTAKPLMTIYGSGNTTLSLNGYQIFNINLSDEEYITLDIANMEAYKDTPQNLKNRLVDGDYNNFALNVGSNQITFSGNVTKLEISNYSRWI